MDCLTSLDPSETNPHPLQRQSSAQRRIHAPVQKLRSQIIEALWTSATLALEKRAQKIGACCVSPTVYIGTGAKPTCSPGRCRDRLCPTCGIHRAGVLRMKIDGLCKRARSIRFLTLTMPANKRTLGQRVDELHAGMRRLRAMKRWKDLVRGGVFTVEATRGSDGKHWHVHAHILIEGDYYHHEQIKADWSHAIGAKAIIHIEAVHDREKAALYLSKYLSKGTDVAAWTDEEIIEFAEQMHRRRVVGTFGKWHRCKVDELDANAPKPPKATHALSFSFVESMLDNSKELRERAAPLLAKLSRTWRLLMLPIVGVSASRWEETTAADFEEITDVLMQFAAPAAPTPSEPKKPKPQQPGRDTLFEHTHR
jgi:hypothetical protein